jgi:MoaA/NifB/PqqE/SkfB family radical SAM enzyme
MTNRLQFLRKRLLAKKCPKTAFRLLTSRLVDKFKLHKETSSVPDLIVLYVSETCNLRCPMCLIWESRNKFGETVKRNTAFTFKDVENIVKQVESFEPIFYLIGGEPTLNRDLITIINYIHKKRNGHLFNNQWLATSTFCSTIL